MFAVVADSPPVLGSVSLALASRGTQDLTEMQDPGHNLACATSFSYGQGAWAQSDR